MIKKTPLLLASFLLFSFVPSVFCAADSASGKEPVIACAFQAAGLCAADDILPLSSEADDETGEQVYEYQLGADGKIYGQGQTAPPPSKDFNVSIMKAGERWSVSAFIRSAKGEKLEPKKHSAKMLEDALRMILMRMQGDGTVFNPLKQVAEHADTPLSPPQNPWPDRQINIFPSISTASAAEPVQKKEPEIKPETLQEEEEAGEDEIAVENFPGSEEEEPEEESSVQGT